MHAHKQLLLGLNFRREKDTNLSNQLAGDYSCHEEFGFTEGFLLKGVGISPHIPPPT